MTTYTWLNPTSGDWTNPLGWLPIGTPGTANSAVFSTTGANYTVAVSASDTIGIINVTLSSANAELTTDGKLTISGVLSDQFGSAVVENGGTIAVTSTAGTSVSEGVSAGGNGTIEVTGANSLLTTAGGMAIGKSAAGTLEALNGGTISLTGTVGLAVGVSAGSTGSILVSGTDASSGAAALLSFGATPKGLFIGGAGTADLTVSNGGSIQIGGTAAFSAGTVGGGAGTITVTGSTSSIDQTSLSGTTIGALGSGQLMILNGGLVTTTALFAGTQSTASGVVTVSGAGSALDITVGGLTIGQVGGGTLNVTAGGSLTASAGGLTIGTSATVDAASATSVGIEVDGNPTSNLGGTLTVQDAGVLNAGTNGIFIGQGGQGTSAASLVVNGGTVNDTGTLNLGGNAIGGNNGNAAMLLEAGGVLNTGTAAAIIDAHNAAPSAGMTVNDATWNDSGQIFIGTLGAGSLTITSAGLVNAGSNTVNVGDGGAGLLAITGGTLDAGVLSIASASTAGTVAVNAGGVVGLAGGSIVAGMTIGTAGVVTLAGGELKIAGLSPVAGQISGAGFLNASLSNTGTMQASGGMLEITGTLTGTGADQIAGGATLAVDGGLDPAQTVSFLSSSTAAALELGSLTAPVQAFGLANWQNGDELVIADGDTVTGAQWLGAGTLQVNTSATTLDFTNVSLAAGTSPIFTTGTNFVELVSCFASGTLIETMRGPVAVEALREGDLLPTLLSEAPAPVIWIGWREIDCAAHPEPATVWPVRIAAGAFGEGAPARDLYLSPDHAVYVNGVLVPARYLINGGSITREERAHIVYFHVELPAHDVIRAEGLPVESYLDIGDREHFTSWSRGSRPRPVVARTWETLGAAPLVVTGPALDAVRALSAG